MPTLNDLTDSANVHSSVLAILKVFGFQIGRYCWEQKNIKLSMDIRKVHAFYMQIEPLEHEYCVRVRACNFGSKQKPLSPSPTHGSPQVQQSGAYFLVYNWPLKTLDWKFFSLSINVTENLFHPNC